MESLGSFIFYSIVAYSSLHPQVYDSLISQSYVVVPLAELEPQLANLMVFDTIIYGDYKIPRSAILIVPNIDFKL